MQTLKGIERVAIADDPSLYVVDGELLIDTGSGLFFKETKDYLFEIGVMKIKTIVNTHGHFNHCGGNKKFRDLFKAEIAVHEAEKAGVENGGLLADRFNEKPKIVTVDRLLRDGSTIGTAQYLFEVIHTPGHSPGSICLYDAQKRILISGDTLFEDGVGRTDLPEGNKQALLSSLRRLAQLRISYLLPAHGSVKAGGIDFLIKQMIAQGKEEAYV